MTGPTNPNLLQQAISTAQPASQPAQPEGDEVLITRAQQGDRNAFGELVCRYRAGVVGVVYRMCGDLRLAEDAAQEAFLRAWQHLQGFRKGQSFRAWVYRIALNAAFDDLRRERPTLELDSPQGEAALQIPDRSSQPGATLEEKERAGHVRRAVLALPPASRSVLVLREYGQLSYTEIAAALGIPLGTVMSRLNSARGQLMKALAGMLEER